MPMAFNNIENMESILSCWGYIINNKWIM